MKSILALFIFITGGVVYYASGDSRPETPPEPEVIRVPERGLGDEVKKPRIVVYRSAQKMELYDDDVLVKSYRIAVGLNQEGNKEREGDKRTPLGEFYVCTRNPESRFHRFMGVSYPTPEDAERGLKTGIITAAEHDKILAAHEEGHCPPWKTALGGEVGIHGGGSDRIGTLGCVGVTDEEISELWSIVRMGDPVTIRE